MKSERKTRILLVGILALGVLFRLGHFWAISGTAFPKIPLVFTDSDLHRNWEWSQRILAGDWLGRDTYHPFSDRMKDIAPLETWYKWWGGKEIFHQAPLYPYWLAGLLALSGGSLPFVLLVQLLMGALQPLIMFGLARRFFDARAGLVAAALTAVYGPFIFYQGVLLRDWLPPILEPLALLALLKARDTSRARDWILAGGVLALAVLTKETVLLFLPLVGVWLLWERWPSWRQIVGAGASLLAGLLLCLSPLVLRNVVVGAPPFALSNRAATSFIGGNALDSSPVRRNWNPATRKAILERSGGRLSSVIRETLKTYQGEFGAFFGKQLLKLRGLVDQYEVPNNTSYYYGLDISPVLRVSLHYGFIFPLGVAGFLVSLPLWWRQRLLYLYVPAVVGGLLFSMILGRYRLLLVPVLILYAAAFLTWGSDLIRNRNVRWLLGGLGLVLGVAVVQQLWLPLTKPEEYLGVQEYHLAAQVYASEGRFDRAMGELERLTEKARPYPDLAWVGRMASLLEGDYRSQWAKQLLGEGRRDEARQQVELARVAYARHPDLSYSYYNLGLLYLRLGEPAKARMLLERFLALDPQHARGDEVRRILGRLESSL